MDIQNNEQVHCVDEYIPNHANNTQTQEIISFNVGDMEVKKILNDDNPTIIKTNRFDKVIMTNNGIIYANGL